MKWLVFLSSLNLISVDLQLKFQISKIKKKLEVASLLSPLARSTSLLARLVQWISPSSTASSTSSPASYTNTDPQFPHRPHWGPHEWKQPLAVAVTNVVFNTRDVCKLKPEIYILISYFLYYFVHPTYVGTYTWSIQWRIFPLKVRVVSWDFWSRDFASNRLSGSQYGYHKPDSEMLSFFYNL